MNGDMICNHHKFKNNKSQIIRMVLESRNGAERTSKVTSDTIKGELRLFDAKLKETAESQCCVYKTTTKKKSKRSKNVNRKGSRLPEAKIKMPRFLKRNRVDSLKWK